MFNYLSVNQSSDSDFYMDCWIPKHYRLGLEINCFGVKMRSLYPVLSEPTLQPFRTEYISQSKAMELKDQLLAIANVSEVYLLTFGGYLIGVDTDPNRLLLQGLRTDDNATYQAIAKLQFTEKHKSIGILASLNSVSDKENYVNSLSTFVSLSQSLFKDKLDKTSDRP